MYIHLIYTLILNKFLYEFCMDIHNKCFAVPFLEIFVNSTKMTMTYHCKIFELEKIPIPFT